MTKAVDPITELKRELAALTKKVVTLEKQLAKAEKCGSVTCTSLTVVDTQGKPVASIDGKGIVACQKAWVAPTLNTRGVFIDGASGSVQCLKVAVVGPTGITELIEMTSSKGQPRVQLRSKPDRDSIRIQVLNKASVIAVTAPSGRANASICASEVRSYVNVANESLGAGSAWLITSHVNGDGMIVTHDHKGATSAVIPPQKEGVTIATPSKEEHPKVSKRKSAK